MPIERSGGGGSAAGGWVKLFDSTLGANAASIDTGAGAIASGHFDLFITGIFRSTEAVVFSDGTFTINNDGGANYDYNYMQVVQSTVQGATANASTGVKLTMPGSSNAANVFNSSEWFIPSYDKTTANKSGQIWTAHTDTVAANTYIRHIGFGWRSTAAITRVAVAAPGGFNLLAGSRLTVYGTQ